MQRIKMLLNNLFKKTGRDDSWRQEAEAIWKTMREINAALANTNATLDNTNATLANANATLANTNATLANTNATLANTNATLDRIVKEREEFAKEMQKLKEAQNELKKSQAITDEQIRQTNQQIDKLRQAQEKTDEQLKKTDEAIDKLKERIEGISTGFGRITIGMTLPCVAKAFSEVGIEVFGTEERVKRRDKKIGQEIEIDILSVASKDGKHIVLLIECATYLREKDVRNFIKKVPNFYHFFPEHKDKELICAVAYIHADTRAVELAQEQNYYLVSMGENSMEIKNKEINPKIYCYKSNEKLNHQE